MVCEFCKKTFACINSPIVSSISWLENNVFLVVHTPQVQNTDSAPESTFHIVTKVPATNSYTFQKLIEPTGPFGVQSRSTPHHFLLRLKDFHPNLQDLIAVASTASTDIGLFTRSKVPLANDKPADKISGVFTLTEMFDDSRRAQLPVAFGLRETSPIGFAFDFSSTEKVLQPIPTDPEITESPTPLPLLTVLNNDGVLSAWWVVHNESIRDGSIYPGLVVAPPIQQNQTVTAPAQTPSAFGTPASATKSPFGAPAFGAPATTSGAFGAPSGLGQKTSVWGASSSTPTQNTNVAFGSPSFGSSSAMGSAPAFGSSAIPGNRASPWSTGAANNAPAFGQSSSFGKPSQPFGASATNNNSTPASGGFASFASGGGFAAAAPSTSTGGSVFGQKAAPSLFGAPAAATSSLFGTTPKTDPKPLGSNGFVLGSTFKADPNAKDDGPLPTTITKDSMFGSGFANSLGTASKSPPADIAVSAEADMDIGDDSEKTPSTQQPVTTTPAATPAGPRFGSSNEVNNKKAPGGGLFGSFTPAQSANKSAGFSFGQEVSNTPKAPVFGNVPSSTSVFPQTPLPGLSKPILPGSQPQTTPIIKNEPASDESSISTIPAAPLPPDTTSKDSYAAGDTSNSSTGSNDAPLPPDFMPKTTTVNKTTSLVSGIPELPPSKPITADMLPPMDVPGGPSSDEGSSGGLTEDDEGSFEAPSGEEHSPDGSEAGSEEGSGEDVADDLSPTSETHQTPAITPHHSFGRQDTSSSGSFFQVQAPAAAPTLFGEIGKSAPVLPPPKVMASPRSPSPVRPSALPGRMLRPEGSRSVSAPGAASQLLGASGRAQVPTPNSFPIARLDPIAEARHRAELKAKQEAEEAIRVLDEQDDEIQTVLGNPPQPTAKLSEFTAHTDYVGASPVESIPQQAESVYRDINSMVDTLGLNARALQAFMLFQNENYHEEGRTREDLENEDDWVLEDLKALSSVISNDLARQLAGGRVKDFARKLEECKELDKEVHRLRAKRDDIQKLFEVHQNGVQDELSRSQPLSAEQAAQQHDLRRDFMKFQTLLAEAEERVTKLKASVVSTSARSGRGQSGPNADAIKRTIAKMTGMAEKRSGDIDVLEGQMRSLGFNSSVAAGDREGSPFTTPQKNRGSVNFGTASTSRFYTPDSIKDPRKSLRNSVMSSSGSPYIASPPRKKLSGYTVEEKAQLKSKLARRKDVMNGLRNALEKSETRVRPLGDE